MTLFLVILFIIIAIGLLYFWYSIDRQEKAEREQEETELQNYDETKLLTEKVYRLQSLYDDKKQDSRTDALLDVLNKIKFWLTIIGIYFLIKIVLWVIVISTKGAIIYELLQLISEFKI